jgi:Protein of unknown function (DUF3147)
MKILINLAALRQVQWYEHCTRFLLGGLISVVAGLIAKAFGPTVGGLFLAFPAIFPASATLLDKHEREKKQKAGIPMTIRGRLAVGLDARGAAMGSIALAGFALVVWKRLPRASSSSVLVAAFATWVVLATGIWRIRKLHVYFSRRRPS